MFTVLPFYSSSISTNITALWSCNYYNINIYFIHTDPPISILTVLAISLVKTVLQSNQSAIHTVPTILTNLDTVLHFLWMYPTDPCTPTTLPFLIYIAPTNIHAVGTGADTWQNLSFANNRVLVLLFNDLTSVLTFQLFDFWCYPQVTLKSPTNKWKMEWKKQTNKNPNQPPV